MTPAGRTGRYAAGPTPNPAQEEEQRVLAGVLRFVREAADTNSPLPGEVDLCGRLNCSRKQVRDVLASLELQGIVLRRQGAATLVDPLALRMSVRFEDQLEYSVLLRQLGFESRIEALSVNEFSLPDDVASLLMAEPGAPAARVVKRWRADETVAMVAFSTLALPREPVKVDFSDSIYTAVKLLWGEPAVWEVATPSAAVLDDAHAALFERPAGSAVMTLDIVGISLSGRRLFHARELHDPAIASYTITRTLRPPQIFSTARYQFS